MRFSISHQITFADWKFNGQRRKIRKEIFLAPCSHGQTCWGSSNPALLLHIQANVNTRPLTCSRHLVSNSEFFKVVVAFYAARHSFSGLSDLHAWEYANGNTARGGLGASCNREHAYVLLSLAATEGIPEAVKARDELEAAMIKPEVKQVQKLSEHWFDKMTSIVTKS